MLCVTNGGERDLRLASLDVAGSSSAASQWLVTGIELSPFLFLD
jgi:hypothetical protein